MVSRLAAFDLGAELARYVDGLGPPERIPVMLLMTLARHCSLGGDQERALRFLDEVHRADPDFPPGLLARAQVLMYFGRLQESARDVERCLRRAPGIAQAHWLRSRLGMPEAGADDAAQLQDLVTKHHAYTNSTVAKFILKDWENQLRHFVKVFPTEYKAALKAAATKGVKSKA